MPASPARRAAVAAATAAAAAVAVRAAWIEPRRLVVREVELRLPGWPARLDGLRAGVVSDLHAGVPHVSLAAVRRVVSAINERAVDVHLLLGDHLDASQLVKRPMRPEAVAAELRRLRAPLGVISVIGNHDWHNAGERMWRALSRAGITVLEDRAIELVAPARAAGSADPAAGGSFWVAGLGDLRHRRPDLGAALAAVPPGAPVLLLSHDPDVFPRVPARVALTLAGHTHGGQIAVPLLRRRTLPSRFGERYARGHIVEGGRHLLVTSGVGTSGLPVRLFAPPEVLAVTLRAGG